MFIFQDILNIFCLSLGSIITLFILTKLIGYHQMSEMTMFDYINGITIGSIAAEMATGLDQDWWLPMTAMITYALMTCFLSRLTFHSISCRTLITGNPLILMQKGQLNDKNMKTGKISPLDLQQQARINGYFQLSDLDTILLEPNGKLSFLPKETNRPINPCDLDLNPSQSYLVTNIMINGLILEDALKSVGKDKNWLYKQLRTHQIHDISNIILATYDQQHDFVYYTKNLSS